MADDVEATCRECDGGIGCAACHKLSFGIEHFNRLVAGAADDDSIGGRHNIELSLVGNLYILDVRKPIGVDIAD